ncbi:MAG: TolC family protein, partial [bacterium]|nr:TolC family protein [bacterium]
MRVRSGIFMAGLVLLSIACAEGVTLEEAWKMALKNHLTLEQQAVVLQRLEEELEVQKAGSLPRFGAMASYGYVSEVPEITLPFVPAGGAPAQLQAGTHNRYEAALTVEQPVFTGFRTRELVGVAREQVKAQGEQRAALREQVLLGVGRVYYQVQLTRLQQETLAQAIGRAEDHLKRVRNFYEAEQATAFDTLEVANRKLELVAQYRRLEHTEDLLRDRLAYAMNVADPPEVPALRPE